MQAGCGLPGGRTKDKANTVETMKQLVARLRQEPEP